MNFCRIIAKIAKIFRINRDVLTSKVRECKLQIFKRDKKYETPLGAGEEFLQSIARLMDGYGVSSTNELIKSIDKKALLRENNGKQPKHIKSPHKNAAAFLLLKTQAILFAINLLSPFNGEYFTVSDHRIPVSKNPHRC